MVVKNLTDICLTYHINTLNLLTTICSQESRKVYRPTALVV